MEKEMRFQIAGIEILEVNLKHPEKALPAPRTYNFETKIKTAVDVEKKLFNIIPGVNVIYDEDKEVHASIQVNFTFSIENMQDFLVENQIDIPEPFLVTLISISISTLRGIMYSQFRGTFMNNTIMPVIDPKSFVKETVE
jgi:hypothetical protein